MLARRLARIIRTIANFYNVVAAFEGFGVPGNIKTIITVGLLGLYVSACSSTRDINEFALDTDAAEQASQVAGIYDEEPDADGQLVTASISNKFSKPGSEKTIVNGQYENGNAGIPSYQAQASGGNTASGLSGTWLRVTDNNSSCRLVLSRTVSWEGFQASGTTGCETTLFMTENWQVSRGVVLIRDHLGDITARMVPQGVNQLTGKLRNGETLILVRN